MRRVYHHKISLFTVAFISAVTVIASPIVAHASGTESASKARQGKLIASDRAAVQRAQMAKFLDQTDPDNAPVPSPTQEAPPARPVSVGTSTPFAAEPRLLHELQADEGADEAGIGHFKVLGGLALMLLVGYGVLRRFAPHE